MFNDTATQISINEIYSDDSSIFHDYKQSIVIDPYSSHELILNCCVKLDAMLELINSKSKSVNVFLKYNHKGNNSMLNCTYFKKDFLEFIFKWFEIND